MTQRASPAVQGVVFVDTKGQIAFAAGLGHDPRVRALTADKAWLTAARQKRLQSLSLDHADHTLLITPFPDGDVIMIGASPNSIVLDFLSSVDFAYDVIAHLLSDPFDGMTIVDKDQRVTYISPVHERFFGLKRGEAIGRPVREVIENTRLGRVIETGRAEVGEIQRMNGMERVVSRIPIKRDGEVIGAIGRMMFKGPEQLENLVRRVNALEGEVAFYKREAAVLRDRSYGLETLLGSSPAMRKLRAEIIKIAPLEIPVLIRGESGTGKELVAHSLHRLSPRRDATMVTLNAAALPATLVEAELFGHEPGAFTGANKSGRRGKFEQAAGGSIFLDEIGDMPREIQAKLLRVLQDRMVERVGGDRPHKVDFRLIAATNYDLKQLVTEGRFRLDLYYRISAIVLEVPPLRMRIGDIPELAQHFLSDVAARHGRPAPELTADALAYLTEQRWPGNVRQLRHEVERAFAFAEGGRITADMLAQYGDPWSQNGAVRPVSALAAPGTTMQEAVSQLEGEVIRQAMARHKGNKKRVATELGISRSYLYKVLDLQGIE